MCNMLGLGDMNADQLASKLEETLPVIRSVSEQFKDPVSPTDGNTTVITESQNILSPKIGKWENFQVIPAFSEFQGESA